MGILHDHVEPLKTLHLFPFFSFNYNERKTGRVWCKRYVRRADIACALYELKYNSKLETL